MPGRDHPGPIQPVESGQRLSPGQLLDLQQLGLRLRQQKQGTKVLQLLQLGAHKHLIAIHTPVRYGNDGLQSIAHQSAVDHAVQRVLALDQDGIALVILPVKFLNPAFDRVLDGVHGKIRHTQQFLIIPSVPRVPGKPAGRPYPHPIPRGQHQAGLAHLVPESFQAGTNRLLILVAVQEHVELVSRTAAHHAAAAIEGLQTLGECLDVAIPIVVSIGIIDVFQIIQIQHQQRGHLQPAPPRRRKKLAQLLVERPAVIEVGQDVEIPLVLDPPLLLHVPGHILKGAKDRVSLLPPGQLHPAVPAAFAGQAVDGRLPAVLIGPQVLHPAPKFRRGQIGVLLRHRPAHQLAQAAAAENALAVLLILENADGDVDHGKDLGGAGGRLCGRIGQVFDCAGKGVDFRHSQPRQPDGLIRVALLQRRDQVGQRLGQIAGRQQHQAYPQGQAHQGADQDQPLDALRAGQQMRSVLQADQRPLFLFEGRIDVVKLQRLDHAVQGARPLPKAHHPLLVGLLRGDGRRLTEPCDEIGAAGAYRGIGRSAIPADPQEVRPRRAVSQLLIPQLSGHVVAAHVDAQHAQKGPVFPDQRDGISDHVPVQFAQPEPAAPVVKVFPAAVLRLHCGSRLQRCKKILVFRRRRIIQVKKSAPIAVQRHAVLPCHRRQSPFQKQIRVARGIAGRVVIPHIKPGASALLLRVVQYQESPRDAVAAEHSDDMLRRIGYQLPAKDAVLQQRFRRQSILVQKFPHGGIDVVLPLPGVGPALHHIVAQIQGAVGGLLPKDGKGVFSRLSLHAAFEKHQQVDCRLQQEQHHQHQQQPSSDGAAADGRPPLPFSFPQTAPPPCSSPPLLRKAPPEPAPG